MCCHSLDILCAFAATQQKYEYPYQRDVESHLMAAIYVLSTGPTVWFQYLEAPILCHWAFVLLGALYQLTTSRKVVSNTRNKHKSYLGWSIWLSIAVVALTWRILIPILHVNIGMRHMSSPYMNYSCSLTCVMCATNLPIRICLSANHFVHLKKSTLVEMLCIGAVVCK